MEEIIQEALTKGVEMHVAGEFEFASQLYGSVIKLQPNHADANHNMGLLKVDTGNDLEALSYLQTALEADTSISQFWLSYIKGLIKLDRMDEATKILSLAKDNGAEAEEFLELDRQLNVPPAIEVIENTREYEIAPAKPNILDTLKLDKALRLAKQKTKEGSSEEAKLIYQDILNRFPKNRKAINGMKALSGGPVGKAPKVKEPSQDQLQPIINLYSQRQFQHALKEASQLLQQFPSSVTLYNISGAANGGLGLLDAAIEAFNKAVSIKPDYAEAYYNMGKVLTDQGKLEEAIEAYNKALTIKPDYADAYNNMGNALKDKGKLEEALEAYKKALAIKPDFAEVYDNMGSALNDQGKREDAIKAHNKALTIKPDYAVAHRHLSSLKKYLHDDKQISIMRHLHQDRDITEDQRCSLSFALAKVFRDLDDIYTSFKYLNEGNALRKKLLGYHIRKDIKLFDSLKSAHQDVHKSAPNKNETVRELTPIFIVGMTRSGTTLTEQIVSSHSKVTGAGELEYVAGFGSSIATGSSKANRDVISQFRQSYLGALEKRSGGKSIVTDKMPGNFGFIGLILTAFPDAKIIHIQRNPAATCWSNYQHYFTGNGLAHCYNLNDLVTYYKLYNNLMQFWQSFYGNRIYNLSYEKLTTYQETETRDLIGYLDIDWEDACLAPQDNKRNVRTASQQQVRRKIYQGSSQAWLKYEPFLDGVFDQFNGSI